MRGTLFYFIFLCFANPIIGQSLLFNQDSKSLFEKQHAISSRKSISEDQFIQFFEINQAFLDRNEFNWIDSSRNLLETKNISSIKGLCYRLHQGIIYKNKGINKKAKIKFEHLAETFQKTGFNKLAILAHIENADFHRSLALLDYSFEEISKINAKKIKNQCYFLHAKYLHRFASITFESQKNRDLAFEYSSKGLDLARKNQDFCTMGTNAMEIGYWAGDSGVNNELSEKYLIKAIEYFEKSNASTQKLNAQLDLSLLYLHNNYKYDKGYGIAESIIEEYKKKPVLTFQIWRVYELLTNKNKEAKNYKKAFEYSIEYQNTYSLYLHRTNIAQIKEVQEEFQNQKLSLEKALLEKDYVSSQSQLNTSESRNIWLIASLVLFTLLFISTIFVLFRIRKVNALLTKQDQLNKRAIAMVSHDFKGTIYSLYPIAKELSNNPENLTISKKLNERIGVMKEVSESLLSWLKASLMKKEANELIEIKPNINYLIGELSSRIQEKHIEIIIESESEHATMELDSDTFNIALRNIVTNAIKYSWDGATIIITFKDNFISVCDFGIGMNQEKMHHLFDTKTNQSVLGTAGEKGFGMGLILTHDLLKESGLTLKVASEKEEGTTFTISK